MDNRKSLQILSGFILKLLAIVFMTLDHVGIFLYAIPETQSVGYVFRIIGRLAFPLYCFFLAEGLRYTRSKEKYLLRIGAMYLGITLVETIFVFAIKRGYTADTLSPEPFTDLFFILLALYCLLLPKWKKIFALFPIALMGLSFGVDVYERLYSGTIIQWFPLYLRFGYGFFGLGLVIAFYFAPALVEKVYKSRVESVGISLETFRESVEFRRQCNIFSIIGLVVVTVIFWGIGYIASGSDFAPFDVYNMRLGSYCLLSGILLYFYSGARGHDSKIFRIVSYAYFPVHLVILYLIFSFIV